MPDLHVIAEVAQGYEGKPLLGELLVRGAAEAGADAVKFQIVFADDVAVPGYRYYSWYQQLHMPLEAWQALKDLAHSRGLKFYADLSGERALELARRLAPDAVKIHSGNFFNHRLVASALEAFPALLVSTGGIEMGEIERFLQRHRLRSGEGKVTFLFGFQGDPTPLERNTLARLPAFRACLDGYDVGFMDHADGAGDDWLSVSIMALALGARIFEKHLTLDRALKLEDYASAVEPARFAQYAQTLRRLATALGDPALALNDAEWAYRTKMVKKLLLQADRPAGHRLSEADLAQKRKDIDEAATEPAPSSLAMECRPPAGGRPSYYYDPDAVIGKTLARARSAGHPLQEGDLHA